MCEDSHNVSKPRGWHSRGYLPHFDGGEILQFVTIHLADALPVKVIGRWREELAREEDAAAQRELFKRRENYLDQGIGECYLRNPLISAMVRESLLRSDNVRYKLLAWVIMPNHIHFLIKPINGVSLSDIMQKFKSYTSHEANKLLDRKGKFWQEDYFDRYIRDYAHYEKTIAYIHNNPLRAGLCESHDEWQFSSAYQAK